MPEAKFKHVCECQKCGNEAEMVISCFLPEERTAESPRIVPEGQGGTRGHAVCTRCGNEADLWLDI